jgi:hypothetical protein
MPYLIPCEVVEHLLHCHHLVWISKCILYPVWLNRRHKRLMFTKMSKSRLSGYPLVNVTKNGVDGVISLNCLVDSWVRWSLILLGVCFVAEDPKRGKHLRQDPFKNSAEVITDRASAQWQASRRRGRTDLKIKWLKDPWCFVSVL